VLLSDTKVLLAFRRPGRPLGATARCPRHGTERKAPSFVIQMTNGTGSIRQFASKAARCKARAAFELCGSPAVVGTAGWRDRGGAPCGVSTDGNARPAFMPQVDQRAGRALRLGGASLVTNPCEKRASLRSRPVAHPRCPRSSGGNSERDGRWALSFGFGRTTGSRPLG